MQTRGKQKVCYFDGQKRRPRSVQPQQKRMKLDEQRQNNPIETVQQQVTEFLPLPRKRGRPRKNPIQQEPVQKLAKKTTKQKTKQQQKTLDMSQSYQAELRSQELKHEICLNTTEDDTDDDDKKTIIKLKKKNKYEKENHKEYIPDLDDLLKINKRETKINAKQEASLKKENKKVQNITTLSQLVEEVYRESSCINPFDKNIREQQLDFIDFTKNDQENENYNPALLQKEQFMSSNIREHLIHQQSQKSLSVKRMCGVSYVMESESKQINVDKDYDILPPIVMQGSYNVQQLSDKIQIQQVDKILNEMLKSNRTLVVSAFQSQDEAAMKNYLLRNDKRLEICQDNIYLIQNGMVGVWPLINDQTFICFHFKYDNHTLIKTVDNDFDVKSTNGRTGASHNHLAHSNLKSKDKQYVKKVLEFLRDSDIQIGILFKKGMASKDSFLKAYGQEKLAKTIKSDRRNKDMTDTSYYSVRNESLQSIIGCQIQDFDQNGVNITALIGRLELYVEESKWKECPTLTKEYLLTLINRVEDHLQECLLRQWNQQRSQCHNYTSNQKNKANILVLKLNQSKNELDLADTQTQSIEIIVTKKNNISENKLLAGIHNLSLPLSLINTRDCFAFELITESEHITEYQDRPNLIKKKYYLNPENLPENYHKFIDSKILKDPELKSDFRNYPIGVTSFENFFTHGELLNIEENVMETERQCSNSAFLPDTAQQTFSGSRLTRTKFFFGYRYMWTKEQLSEPFSQVAAGVRKDVSRPPVWVNEFMVSKMEKCGIVEKNFINSIAMNVYHDGTEGLAQHYDDATRFKQFYGFVNGAFFIPLARGCICVMEENGYAANGVKHCIRPQDMTGKSAALILRQMHPNVVKEAELYDRFVELPMWMSTLSIEDASKPFKSQKTQEAKDIMHIEEQCKKNKKNKQQVLSQKSNQDQELSQQAMMGDPL
eukprot:403336135